MNWIELKRNWMNWKSIECVHQSCCVLLLIFRMLIFQFLPVWDLLFPVWTVDSRWWVWSYNSVVNIKSNRQQDFQFLPVWDLLFPVWTVDSRWWVWSYNSVVNIKSNRRKQQALNSKPILLHYFSNWIVKWVLVSNLLLLTFLMGRPASPGSNPVNWSVSNWKVWSRWWRSRF